MILDIVGKESPIICGLGVSESFEVAQTQSTETPVPNETVHPSGHECGPSTSRKARKRKVVESTGESDDKNEKPKLQIEHIKLQIYKTKLEILKLEKDLGLPFSEFTSQFQNNFQSENGKTYLSL
ncbi:uncharacterized protein LOC126735715 [Anthonomus grandis grandis]|uniref:uncharacterized protein LOC126735715 n=1 Tax=Anthonomus grandis grandis TaxID=2921223 RepID=UPI002166BAFD|nr:uncharacterized protein LOC126735715 [Anthonomus grandis grandis]